MRSIPVIGSTQEYTRKYQYRGWLEGVDWSYSLTADASDTDMMLDYLRDPQRFASGELGRVATLPVGVERPQR
jgi:hypothetical protein